MTDDPRNRGSFTVGENGQATNYEAPAETQADMQRQTQDAIMLTLSTTPLCNLQGKVRELAAEFAKLKFQNKDLSKVLERFMHASLQSTDKEKFKEAFALAERVLERYGVKGPDTRPQTDSH